MRTVNITQFIRTLKCPKCSNEVLYDDTPYHRIKDPKNLQFEIACPKCGKRLIYDKEFNRLN